MYIYLFLLSQKTLTVKSKAIKLSSYNNVIAKRVTSISTKMIKHIQKR